MRTRVVLLPGALESEGEAPLFEPAGPALCRMLERGQLSKVHRVPSSTPELEWLGIDPRSVEVSQGVLMVAALGAESPDRSVHFHLSLLAAQDGRISKHEFTPLPQELETILEAARRLETSRLKLVEGRDLDHALVWEDGSIELLLRTPEEAFKIGLRASLPEGDGEKLLRRFIDDSVNLLGDLELNRIREAEGLLPFNLLWPWGRGFRPRLPNLTVERGTSLRIESPSVRLSGLSRMVGYRHSDPWEIGTGTNIKLEAMANSILSSPYGMSVIPNLGLFRSQGKEDEAEWLGREIQTRLIEPLGNEAIKDPRRVLLIATQENGSGLALDYRSDGPVEGSAVPFSVLALDERALIGGMLYEKIEEALTAI